MRFNLSKHSQKGKTVIITKESNSYTVENEEVGRMDAREGGTAEAVLTVRAPIGSTVTLLRAYFANLPYGNGNSDLGTPDFVETPIVGYHNIQYQEWPGTGTLGTPDSGGFAYAKIENETADNESQLFSVRFINWRSDNGRRAQLAVHWS